MLACGIGEKKAGPSAFQRFRRHDFDAETAEADISALARGQQADRGNAEILEDLRAQADLAPLLRARSIRAGVTVRDVGDRNAGSAVAQVDDHTAPSLFEACQ